MYLKVKGTPLLLPRAWMMSSSGLGVGFKRRLSTRAEGVMSVVLMMLSVLFMVVSSVRSSKTTVPRPRFLLRVDGDSATKGRMLRTSIAPQLIHC